MNFSVNRLARFCAWSLVLVLVMLALFVTALRVTLPHLNSFQNEITAWIKQDTGLDVSISNVMGSWRNSHPSLQLQGLQANLPQEPSANLKVDKIDIEFDLLRSVFQLKPVISDLDIDALTLDIRSVDLLSKEEVAPNAVSHSKITAPSQVGHKRSKPSALSRQIDSLLLRQLQDFTLNRSQIWYRSISQEPRRLDIEQLRWRNRGCKHRVEGVVNIIEPSLNSLLVSANFTDFGSLRDISGEFFASAQNVSIGPWLTQHMQEESGIESGEISLNSWLTLEHGKPNDAYVEILPSRLIWNEKGRHELVIESGIFKLSPNQKGWKAQANALQILTDGTLFNCTSLNAQICLCHSIKAFSFVFIYVLHVYILVRGGSHPDNAPSLIFLYLLTLQIEDLLALLLLSHQLW